MVIFDTNIIIDHLRQLKGSPSLMLRLIESNPHEQFAISILSVQELYEGKSTREEMKEQLLLSTLSSFQVLPYTYAIAQMAGKIARDSETAIEFTDAAIAATAIVHNAQLSTLNRKHFLKIANLQVFSSRNRLIRMYL